MKIRTYFLILSFLFVSLPAKADFISLIQPDQCETIIEIYVEGDQIRVTYEIGMTDWRYFDGIVPDNLLTEELRSLVQPYNLNHFFNNEFVLSADGKILYGSVIRQEIIPRIYRASLYTGVVEENAALSKEVLYTEIVYPIINKPNVLEIRPPMEAGAKMTMANIGFVAYHNNIPVNDLRYLSGKCVLNLDWTDPWYSYFNNKNLRRHHQSSVMSFLYVDPYEVRHEVLLRVKDIEEWLDLGYQLDDYIEIEDQDALTQRIAEFLATKNIVTIDGKVGKPIIDKIQFVKWSLAGIQIQEIKERMAYSSAVIGIIYAYPHPGIAQEITINWDLFSDKIREVPNVATDPVGPMPYVLRKDDNILTWKNFMKKYKLPTISEVNVSPARIPILHLISGLLIVIGTIDLLRKRPIKKNNILKSAIIIFIGFLFIPMSSFFDKSLEVPFIEESSFSKPKAKELINHLLKNTYRAFDFRDESIIYDKLAISNSEDLLADLYIQTKKSMVIENQGGIQVKVKDVEILEVEETDSDEDGLSFKCSWVVKGDVGHWGHIHSRTNQYRAILNVRPNNGVWKLHNIDIIEEVRL